MGANNRESKLEHFRLLARRSGSLNVNIQRASSILRLVRQGASATEIESEVLLSPDLSINLIKLASSPAYGAMEISSVKFAIELLGWKELESLMATLLVNSLEQGTSEKSKIDGHKFRQRALVQAFVARALAKKHAPMNADEMYTAGLFLDAGYLLLGIHLPLLLLNLRRMCERTPGIGLIEAEQEVLGFTHAEVSAVMAEEFKLSSTVVECMRCHHDPIEATADNQALADICNVASGLADTLELDVMEGLPRMGYDKFACQRLEIDPDTLAETAQALTSRAFAVANTLGSSSRAA